jgi:hypothetical protein
LDGASLLDIASADIVRRMIGNIIGMVIGIGAFLLGGKGFTSTGLPFTRNKHITGAPAKIIGTICMLVGAIFFCVSAYYAVQLASAR